MAPDKLTAKQALEKLTPQRRKFVLAFCDTFKATKAALAAGYSKKTARTQGSYLLTLVDIKTAIKGIFNVAGMDPEEIAARWDRIARADLSDFYTVEEYEVATEVQQSLVNAIAEIEEDIDYERQYMVRAWDVLGLDPEARGKEMLDHDKWAKRRQLDILRYEMKLERNPAAVRLIAGPKVKKQRVVLDLVKAESLGMLDLIKAIVPTEHGTKVELRSPDAALDNLAKWRGMLTTKIDLTTKGEALAPPPIVGELTAEHARAILDARRRAREKEVAGE